MLSLEDQLSEIGIQLNKNKNAHKNKVTLVELEAFKLATRNEFQSLLDFKLEQLAKVYASKFLKIDARLEELGKECAEIIPTHTFTVSLPSFDTLCSHI